MVAMVALGLDSPAARSQQKGYALKPDPHPAENPG